MENTKINTKIKHGTIRDKLLRIIDEDAKAKLGLEKNLNEEEYWNIRSALTSSKTKSLYNKLKKIDERVVNAINYIQGLTFEIQMNYSNLRGYILLWESIESSELMLNLVLNSIDNKALRSDLISLCKKECTMLANAKKDKEGYIELEIKQLLELINNVKNSTNTSLIKFLSWRQAILDFMKKSNYEIPTYKNELIRYTELISLQPIIGLDKFESSSTSFKNMQISSIDKFKHHYSITPNLSEIKIDQNIYNGFTKVFLEYENEK